MMAINSLTQIRTFQLMHAAQPYVISGINAYRMYGISVEQPRNQLWTQKRPFPVHIFGFLRMTLIGRRYFPDGNDENTTTEDDSSTQSNENDKTSASLCITPQATQTDYQTPPYLSTRSSTHLHSLIQPSKSSTSATTADKPQAEGSPTKIQKT